MTVTMLRAEIGRDYKVKGILQADFGRLEIILAEVKILRRSMRGPRRWWTPEGLWKGRMKEMLVSVSEETTPGVKRLYQMHANGTLLFSEETTTCVVTIVVSFCSAFFFFFKKAFVRVLGMLFCLWKTCQNKANCEVECWRLSFLGPWKWISYW